MISYMYIRPTCKYTKPVLPKVNKPGNSAVGLVGGFTDWQLKHNHTN